MINFLAKTSESQLSESGEGFYDHIGLVKLPYRENEMVRILNIDSKRVNVISELLADILTIYL
eukprot:snap_masked-scaffold_26-processed-gene-1.34-mRNA-1 protein AED:1.00 eAED:1.00 QI:0/0/0/0/1/1/2/0/62